MLNKILLDQSDKMLKDYEDIQYIRKHNSRWCKNPEEKNSTIQNNNTKLKVTACNN